MKSLTITLAAAFSLSALTACNAQEAANNTAENAVLPLDNATTPDANAVDGDKPVDNAVDANAAAPAGDKPAADNATEASATDEPPAGDKPTE